jgi:hypothetical protein
MGRQPRSGDIPWLSAHSILNWIGGDTSMLILLLGKSRISCRFLQWHCGALIAGFYPFLDLLGTFLVALESPENRALCVDINSFGR